MNTDGDMAPDCARNHAGCARPPAGRTVAGVIVRVAFALVIALGVSGALSACGKKGDLEPPPGEKSQFPKTYPDPKTYPHPSPY